MTIQCHRFGCNARVEWVGKKTQEEVEHAMFAHLQNECTGHNWFAAKVKRERGG